MQEFDERAVRREVARDSFSIAVRVILVAAIPFAAMLGVLLALRVPGTVSLLAAGGVSVVVLHIYGAVTDRQAKRKRRLFKEAMDNFGPVPANENDFPWLDRDAVKLRAFHLESLGFRNTADYTIGTGGVQVPGPKLREVFLRVMISPEHHCFAEIGQSFMPGRTQPEDVSCGLTSLYDSGDQCRTAIGEPQASASGPQLMKYQFCVDVTSVSELLSEHLRQRNEVLKEHGFSLVTDLSQSVYIDSCRRRIERVREFAKQIIEQHTGSLPRI